MISRLLNKGNKMGTDFMQRKRSCRQNMMHRRGGVDS